MSNAATLAVSIVSLVISAGALAIIVRNYHKLTGRWW